MIRFPRITHLRTENQIYREILGKRRILLSDAQRQRLAEKGRTLGRKLLAELASIVTPDTLLRWHRELVVRKWDFSSLSRALAEFVANYHGERNHRGLGNLLIEPGAEVGRAEGGVACRNRLGGLLRYYYRKAA